MISINRKIVSNWNYAEVQMCEQVVRIKITKYFNQD